MPYGLSTEIGNHLSATKGLEFEVQATYYDGKRANFPPN